MNTKITNLAQQKPKLSNKFEIMGILNATPDSFSDGGKFNTTYKLQNQIYNLLESGADIIDLGAESTKPGSYSVSAKEQWKRIESAISTLSRLSVKWSIDSSNFEVINKALDQGASIVNNVRGLLETKELKKIASYNCEYICMHMHQNPKTMQLQPLSSSAGLSKVEKFFSDSFQKLLEVGLSENRIWLDPGIGFGKDDSLNLQLMNSIPFFSKLYNITIGVSRKSWLQRTMGLHNFEERDIASKTMELGLVMLGAKRIRTHDVKGLATLKKAFYDFDQ